MRNHYRACVAWAGHVPAGSGTRITKNGTMVKVYKERACRIEAKNGVAYAGNATNKRTTFFRTNHGIGRHNEVR